MPVVTTKPCWNCNQTSEIELSDEEFAALNAGKPVQEALLVRSADFRELFITGIHPECWQDYLGPEPVEEDGEWDEDDFEFRR